MKTSKNSVLSAKFISVKNTFLFRNLSSHIHLIVTFTTLPGCYNRQTKSSKFGRHFQLDQLRVLLTRDLEALKEYIEHCDKNFFSATNYHRFHVRLFKPLSPQLNDQAVSDSIFNTLLLPLIYQDLSLIISKYRNDTDVD